MECCGEIIPEGFTHVHRGAGDCPTCREGGFYNLRVHWWFAHGRRRRDQRTASRYLITASQGETTEKNAGLSE